VDSEGVPIHLFARLPLSATSRDGTTFSGRTEQPERLHLIERSGAGSAGRTCLAPSSVANPDACKIILSWLQHDLSGIVFVTPGRQLKNLLGFTARG